MLATPLQPTASQKRLRTSSNEKTDAMRTQSTNAAMLQK
jgi:hypothetical protein